VLELDVNGPDRLTAVAADLGDPWGRVDGVLHSIAFAPEDGLGGRFLETPPESATTASQTSAFSLKALTVGLADLYLRSGASIVGMDFDASVGVAGIRLDGRRQGRARGDRALPRPRSRPSWRAGQLGGCRAAGDAGRPGDPRVRRAGHARGRQPPLGWDGDDASPVAGAILFLLSDMARGISGEILHVDGGRHAMRAPLSSTPAALEGALA
jgi:enoyl-[acyl-carrier protein] reductase I